MSDFAKWLVEKDSSRDADLNALQNFARSTAGWPYWSNRLSDYLTVVNATPSNEKLLRTLEDTFTRWIREEGAGRNKMTIGEIFVSQLGVILLGSAALLFLIGAFVGLANSDFYSSLTRTEQGRGLITFLFALTATAVILIISIAIFWFENTDDLSKRIVPAKDVLTVVIGVLGTIMGFYFGSTTDARLSIGNLALSPTIATVTDKTVKLQARVIGGAAPYQYTISFGETSVSKSSPNALIEESLDISKLSGLTHAVITIAVTDARGNQAHSSTVLPIQAGTGQPAPPQNTPGPATPPTNP